MSAPATAGMFSSPADVGERLAQAGYIAGEDVATTVFLADRLGKPLLVEGPAGVGKTELAKAVAFAAGAGLVRLQCYEGLDEARALYEWDYKKQLLMIQATGQATDWSRTQENIFSEEFLLPRPLLTAIQRDEPTVLLVDETDKADVEVEALLLEVLSDFQVTIPEVGTVRAKGRPFVVLTSNAARELSEALKRRCLHLGMEYPSADREAAIVASRAPEVAARLARQVIEAVHRLRAADLRKKPSIAETIDWARALHALGVTDLDAVSARQTLGAVLKHASDRERVGERLASLVPRAAAPGG